MLVFSYNLLNAINHTDLTTSCLLPIAYPNQEINFARLLISYWSYNNDNYPKSA